MKKLRFSSNNNTTIVGINDAGIETFAPDMTKSLERENIQNALDAVLEDSNKPVEIEFVQFEIPTEKLPDVNGFRNAIRKCKESNKGEPDAYKFFEDAEKTLSGSKLKILRISDHNTKGLEGSDTCAKGTSWSRLVKESGSSNKGEGSGGSFGIGKNAAFACSDLRTVFYSSKDKNGLVSNIGVAKMVSFEDEGAGKWTSGIGFYSEDDRFVAINELADFDEGYKREDSGTDIYIIGMHEVENFKEEFIRAVLLDFLVSLVKKKLVVKVQGEVIDSTTLPKYMSKLNPHGDEQVRDLLEYYHILTSHDPKVKVIPLDSEVYGKEYGFKNGECTLYLKEGEGLNRKIMITRKAGMRILEQNRISGSIDFTGVLVIDGPNMNEKFKRMEVPSHDAWEPGRVRGEERKYKNILDGLKKYLRDTVKDMFGKVSVDDMDAFGASDFLPDKHDDNDEKLEKDEMSTRIRSLEGRQVEPTGEKEKYRDVDIDEVDGGNDKGAGGSGPGQHPGPEPGPGPHPGPNPGPFPGPGPEPGPDPSPIGDKPGKDKEYKEITVKKRLICSNETNGVYSISFVIPSSASKGKLVFSLSGEQSDFELPIIGAKVLSGEANIESVEGNSVYLTDMEKGKSLRVEVQVDFDKYCMMEVDYYANKK